LARAEFKSAISIQQSEITLTFNALTLLTSLTLDGSFHPN